MSDWYAMKASSKDCMIPLSSDAQKAPGAQCGSHFKSDTFQYRIVTIQLSAS